MSWGAVAGAVVGAGVSAYGSNKAAGAAAKGADANAAVQQYMYDTARNDLAPYRRTGELANNELNALLSGDFSGFTESPGYQFRLDEGNKAVQNYMAARGQGFSGNALKAISDYNQNTASSEYGNYWNRLFNLQGSGQNAASQTGAFGASAATNMGNAMQSGANARASGYLAQGDIFNSLANGLGSAWNNRNSGMQ